MGCEMHGSSSYPGIKEQGNATVRMNEDGTVQLFTGTTGLGTGAHIALSQDWMMTENGRIDLAPGMAVSAEIQTGERRLISYLLSPLVRHASESMHER